MHNVAPTRALARRSRQLLQLAFVVAAVGVFIAVIGGALFVIELTARTSPLYGTYNVVRILILFLGAAVVIAAFAMAIRAVTWKTDNELANVVGKFMSQFFDNRFHFIRNVSKRELGYIDAVLIGPPGALVFRIINITGVLANEGADWLKETQPGQWVPAGINVTREAVDDIKHLREYLATRQLGDVPVFGIIVFTKEEPALRLMEKDPVVPFTHLSRIKEALENNYLAKERIDANKVLAVVRQLYEN